MSASWNEVYLIAVLDYAFGQVGFTPPAAIEFALYVGGNPMDPAHTACAEMAGSSYARAAEANDTAMWTTGTNTQSLKSVTWGPASANWPPITAAAVIDVSASPEAIMTSLMPVGPVVVTSGDTLTAAVGDLGHGWGSYVAPGASPPASTDFTDALTAALLNLLMGAVPWVAPYEITFSLWTGDPYFGGSEVVGTGYSRLELDNNTTTWHTGGAVKTNKVPLRWPAAGVAGTDWGTVTHVGVHYGPSGDLMARAGGSSQEVRAGKYFLIPAGSLRLTLNQPI